MNRFWKSRIRRTMAINEGGNGQECWNLWTFVANGRNMWKFCANLLIFFEKIVYNLLEIVENWSKCLKMSKLGGTVFKLIWSFFKERWSTFVIHLLSFAIQCNGVLFMCHTCHQHAYNIYCGTCVGLRLRWLICDKLS